LPILIAAFRNKITLNDSTTSIIIYTGALVLTFLFGFLMLDWNFPTLYLVLLLFTAGIVRKRVTHPALEWIMAAAVVVVIVIVQITALNHLPLKDYRPYAVGESILENRMFADELGLVAPVYATEYLFKNIHTGEESIVLSSDYLILWNDSTFTSTYELVTYDGAEVVLSEGYVPRILDFQMINKSGDDLTDTVLADTGYTFLHISKDLDVTNGEGQSQMNALAAAAKSQGFSFYGLTNVGYDLNENFRNEFQAPYEFLTCDQTELKIVIRSNPGLVLIKDGVVVEKWAWRDIPAFEDLNLNLTLK